MALVDADPARAAADARRLAGALPDGRRGDADEEQRAYLTLAERQLDSCARQLDKQAAEQLPAARRAAADGAGSSRHRSPEQAAAMYRALDRPVRRRAVGGAGGRRGASSGSKALVARSEAPRAWHDGSVRRQDRRALRSAARAFERALQLMPGGVNSPARAFGGVGGAPVFIDRAEGAYLFDVDGNRYIDYIGSWGPMILGHRPSGGRRGGRSGASRAARASARRPRPRASWPS